MNNIQVFNNSEFGDIRTVEIDGEVWFVGKDVATALGYAKTENAIARHVDKEDKTLTPFQGGCSTGIQKMTIINESGLYALTMSSKLPSAKKFKHWVTSEVLPTIRKTGAYVWTPQNMTDYEIIAAGLEASQRVLAKKEEEIKFKDKQLIAQQEVISELQPKADYVDMILNCQSLVLTTQIAKDYGMSARSFNKLLHELGIQYKVGDQWVLYAKYQACGYVHSTTYEYTRRGGIIGVRMRTEWTQKGRLFLYETLKKEGYLPLIETLGNKKSPTGSTSSNGTDNEKIISAA